MDGWAELEVGVDRKAALSSIYPQDVIDSLVQGLDTGSRWGFDQGFGSLTAALYDTRVIAEIVREYLDDEIGVDDALARIQSETEALMDLSLDATGGEGAHRSVLSSSVRSARKR